MKASALLFAAFATLAISHSAHAQSVERVTNVISGKLARAGSSNRQPYSDSALQSLCQKGYTLAIYTYGGARSRTVSCGGGRSIRYQSMTNWSHPSSIINAAEREMRNGGRVMIHCWYGVHASNFVTSAILGRVCNYSASKIENIFRRGIPRGSLAQSRIDQLANDLHQYANGGSVMGGCP